ncbi:MAG: hypothetical protein ACRDTG_10690 [Pseudonocardiaceae bacterium]
MRSGLERRNEVGIAAATQAHHRHPTPPAHLIQTRPPEPTPSQRTRLRRNGLITRVKGRNLYQLTDGDLVFAIFYTKVHNRVLRPLLATTAPQAPPPRSLGHRC